MLRSLEIHNFQSHKDSTFDFGNGVNAITGTSRHGKSASLRAINWIINNRPSGEGHVSFWAWDKKGKQIEPTSAKITTDHHVVERIRSATMNGYIIDGKPLEAIGTDVPKEVTDALNFSDMNIQAQMDKPFLLADSAGEVGRFFNKIVKLDAIDVFQSAIDAKKRKTKTDLDANKGNLERVEKELKGFAWVDDARVIIDKLQDLETKGWELEKVQFEFKESLETHEKFQQILENLKIIPKALKLSEKIDILRREQANLNNEADGLSNSIDVYNAQKSLLAKSACIVQAELNYAEIIKAMQKRSTIEQLFKDLSYDVSEYITYVRIAERAKDVDYAEKLAGKIDKLRGEKKGMREMVVQLDESVKTYHIDSEIVDGFEEVYIKLQNSLPSVCPTCRRPL